MNVETIKTGKCPVCSSNEVYDNNGKSKNGDRAFTWVHGGSYLHIITYVCMNCGYFKEFLDDADTKDEKLIAKVKTNWNKTSGGNIG
jgi:uncharacterized Zn finger protein